MLRDLYAARHKMPLDFEGMGRNVKLVISNCASGIMVNPTGKEKRRVLHHKVVDDGAYCELELKGYEDPDRQHYTLDHEFNVMHGRRVNGVFEYQYLVYRVPEQDWPYVADVIRASARSFEPFWEPTKPKASKRAKRKKKG